MHVNQASTSTQDLVDHVHQTVIQQKQDYKPLAQPAQMVQPLNQVLHSVPVLLECSGMERSATLAKTALSVH